MPTIPRTYLMTSKAEASAIQPKSGQIISLYDSDEIYFDVPAGGDSSSSQVDRRKVSGTQVISEADLAEYKPVGTKTPMTDIIYVVTRAGDTQAKLPDGTPLFDSRIWYDNNWHIIGTNKDDIYVKSEPSDGKFYLVGAADDGTVTSTLLKNTAVYVDNGVINASVSHAEESDHATSATYDAATPTPHEITDYLYDVSSDYQSNPGTVLTFTLGNGTTKPVQVSDTKYSVFSTNSNGLVPGPTSGDADKFLKSDGSWATAVTPTVIYTGATASAAGVPGLVPSAAAGNLDYYLRGDGTWGRLFSSNSAGLVPALPAGQVPADAILTGTGWANKPTVDSAEKDGLGQVIASTYIKDGSFDTSTNKLVLTYGDSTVAVPHIDEITIQNYGVFNTADDGLVPHPTAADASKVLSSAGTWVDNNVIDATNNINDPLFVVGADSQSASATTNSNSYVFIQDNKLYQAGADLEQQDTFTGDGSNTSFTLSYSAASITEVTVNGSTVSSGYDLQNNAVVFDTAPANNDVIVVVYNAPNSAQVVDETSSQMLNNKTYEGYTLGSACSADLGTSLDPTSTILDTFTGDGAEDTFTLTHTLIDIVVVTINSTTVPTTDYTVSGNDITFNTAPTSGAAISITYTTDNPGYGASKLPTSNAVLSYIADNITPRLGVDLGGTLTAGSTSLTISSSYITTGSMLEIYTDVYGLQPTNVAVTTGQVVLTFTAQGVDLNIKVKVI